MYAIKIITTKTCTIWYAIFVSIKVLEAKNMHRKKKKLKFQDLDNLECSSIESNIRGAETLKSFSLLTIKKGVRLMKRFISEPKIIEEVISAFSRTTEEIFSLDELKRLLSSGRQLRMKFGVDVTAPDLHIGHAVNLWMYRKLQDYG